MKDENDISPLGHEHRKLFRLINSIRGRSMITSSETDLGYDAFDIEAKLQSSLEDCGQTCLDMLGYDGHKMFPDKELHSYDLRSLAGVREANLQVGQEESINYMYPHMWLMLGKGKVEGAMHWVIRYRDYVCCPTVGKILANEYKNKYVAHILQVFLVPANGQTIPDAVYKQYIGQDSNEPPHSNKIEDRSLGNREFSEYGSWQWAQNLARKTGTDANYWYHSTGAKAYREENQGKE